MANTYPLSTLLSQLLIAFTIEFDNEFEHQSPHWTTSFGPGARGGGPWLGSMVLWANAMRLVPEEGITVAELQSQARTESLQLAGLERWGYVIVAPNPRRHPGKAAPAGLAGSSHCQRPQGAGGMASARRRHRRAMEGAIWQR